MDKNLDSNFYKNFYNDLSNLNENELKSHYINCGINENRFSNDSDFHRFFYEFDFNFYKNFYNDMTDKNDIEIKKHYYYDGKNENRYANDLDFHRFFYEFDLNFYKNFYNDLREKNDIEIKKHYYYYGKNENRFVNDADFHKFFPEFDIKYYKNFNEDLKNKDDIELKIHYYLYKNSQYRIINNNTFYNFYPYFKTKLYTIFNDINEVNDYDIKLHYYNNKLTSINSFKKFYNEYQSFDLYSFKRFDSNVKDLNEEDTIIYWYINYYNKNLKYNKLSNNIKNILIYPHTEFKYTDGGITVQYYLASLLEKYGIKTRIFKNFNINEKNYLFNNYYDNDIDMENTITIYCEGIEGNPLNVKNVVRWMLSELGKNVPYEFLSTWDKKELVYYFNSENKFNIYSNKINTIYKNLTVIYINPLIKNYNFEKSGQCHTYRKSWYHKNINILHNNNSFEITRFHNNDDYINIFNKYKYFISYDPNTFLSIIAPLCGCISIIHPIDGLSKFEWLQKSAVEPYLRNNNIKNLYGIAYGLEDLDFAEKTIHLVNEQWNEIYEYNYNTLLLNFINDINNFNDMENTIKNNFY